MLVTWNPSTLFFWEVLRENKIWKTNLWKKFFQWWFMVIHPLLDKELCLRVKYWRDYSIIQLRELFILCWIIKLESLVRKNIKDLLIIHPILVTSIKISKFLWILQILKLLIVPSNSPLNIDKSFKEMFLWKSMDSEEIIIKTKKWLKIFIIL